MNRLIHPFFYNLITFPEFFQFFLIRKKSTLFRPVLLPGSDVSYIKPLDEAPALPAASDIHKYDLFRTRFLPIR